MFQTLADEAGRQLSVMTFYAVSPAFVRSYAANDLPSIVRVALPGTHLPGIALLPVLTPHHESLFFV